MKQIRFLVAIAVIGLFASASLAAGTPAMSNPPAKTSATLSVQAKVNSAVIPASKTNWSKIKDLFL